MPLPKTVTAQDVTIIPNDYDTNLESLLSRARQEAVAEELKNKRSELTRIAESLELMSMTKSGYPGHTEAVTMVLGENERLKYLMQDERVKKARREGRLEGLKDMDEAWRSLDVPKKLRDSFKAPVTDRLYSLRQEYQQDPSK
jgi:translation elongation factor EF-1beta